LHHTHSRMEIVEIGDLLLYNEDLDDAPAKALVA
jgi:hypothetical protein